MTIVPTIGYTAAQSPAVQCTTSFKSILNGPVVTPSITTGDILAATALNNPFARIDLQESYKGAWGIEYGLSLSATGSNLQVTVSAGHANIGGIIQLTNNLLVGVPDGHSPPDGWVALWLTQLGGVAQQLNTLAPPSGVAAIFLGRVFTSGGVVVGIDLSGVVYVGGGQPTRFTADTGTPTDTPPAEVRITTTGTNGLALWNGQSHSAITVLPGSVSPAQLTPGIPYTIRLLFNYNEFSDTNNSHTINFVGTYPGTLIRGLSAYVSVPFTGGSVSALTLEIGAYGGVSDYYMPAWDAFSAPTGMIQSASNSIMPVGNMLTSTELTITATATGDTLNNLTAGQVEIWLEVIQLPTS